MKPFALISFVLALGLAGAVLPGCGKPHEGSHGHSHDHDHGHDHEHAEETSGGASFKPDQGVLLTEETRRSLAIETAGVSERPLPLEIRFTAQVFGEHHRATAAETYHAECTAKASGLLAQEKAALVRPGQPAQLATRSGDRLGGVVLGLSRALALGDAEVVVGVTNAAAQLPPGEFLAATIVLPRAEAVPAVPKSAILRTAEGRFVYTVNGDAYRRTPVKTGVEAGGFVEITAGARPGDTVVTQPVEKLWLIELRATKGGGHSH